MKQNTFKKLGDILNTNNAVDQKKDFLAVYVSPNYAVETLVNGNITECITHLRDLISSGITGVDLAYEQLNEIKIQVPEKYKYVKDKVFSYRSN